MIIIMGVSGTGKTSLGKQLSQQTTWPFYDADDFHTKSNKDKMKLGLALEDSDRKPWLSFLAKKIQAFGKENLSDILHYTAVGLKSLFECHTVRINLEDLHQGILICQYMTEQKHPDERQITKFISHRNSIISQSPPI